MDYPFGLPFLTRDMLRFGQTSKIEIRVAMIADEATTLSIKGITREGQFTFKATTPSNSQATTQTFGIPDIPTLISIEDTLLALEQGQCFVTVSLLMNGEVVQQLISGYVYGRKSISWPYGQNNDLRPGGGRLQSFSGTNPAAGSEITEIVPTGEIWKIISLQATLVTSATVATRRVHLEIFGNGSDFRTYALVTQAASLSVQYTMANWGDQLIDSNDNVVKINLPPLIFAGPGAQISTEVTNLQAGDNWGAPVIAFEKFFTTS